MNGLHTRHMAAAMVAFCGLAAGVHGQACTSGQWTPEKASSVGIGGSVLTTVLWDSDGAGPQPPRLVAGGSFTIAGKSITANNIALWDPAQGWLPLGIGFSGPVRKLIVHNGQLIAGGEFVAFGSGATNLARWDGSAWQPVGGGVSGPAFVPGVGVRGLASLGTDLYVGGSFSDAGGSPALNLAKWDGASWQAFNADAVVNSLTVYNGEIYAGGDFSNVAGTNVKRIARLSGGAAFPVGGGVFVSAPGINSPSSVTRVLGASNGKLYIAGQFIGPADPNSAFDPLFESRSIMAWNGSSFESVGPSGLCASVSPTTAPRVDDIAFFGGSVYAVGNIPIFPATCSAAPALVMRWDGTSWTNPGASVASAGLIFAPAAHVSEFNGEILLGATGSTQQSSYGAHVLRGGVWTELTGAFNYAFGGGGSLASLGSTLYSSGITWAEGVRIPGAVARLDGTTWSSIGFAPAAGGASLLRSYANDLYIMGSFVNANSVSSGNIIRYSPTSGTFSQVGGVVNGNIVDAVVFNNELWIAGQLSSVAGTPVVAAARWNGSSWQVADTAGVNFISSFSVHNGQLFATALTTSGRRVLQWSGTDWVQLPGAFNGDVTRLASFGGQLYAAGSFSSVGFLPASGIAVWNGSTWDAVGSGLALGFPPTSVTALYAFDGKLYVGGAFTAAGGVPVQGIASWDGSSWSDVDGGVQRGLPPTPGIVNNIFSFNGQLVVSGSFTRTARGVAAGTAFFGCATLPACYANCDGSTAAPVLNALDFSCFLGRYVAADPYANCDGSTAAPVLNALDFSCFLGRYVAGCP